MGPPLKGKYEEEEKHPQMTQMTQMKPKRMGPRRLLKIMPKRIL